MECKQVDRKYCVDKIDTLEQLKQIFDWEKLNEENEPSIVVTKPTVIVFDSFVWNSTYLLDLFNNIFDSKTKNVDMYYCDSIDIRNFLQYKGHVDLPSDTKNYPEYEKHHLKPGFMIIKPEEKELLLVQEYFVPITEEGIFNTLTFHKLIEA